ncbi:MAG: GntR family transcriptional regulator [Terrimicrobiaceae bacterium]|jgi:DNA-binding GntR family transcriptional regulator
MNLTPLQAKVFREAGDLLRGLKPGDDLPSERELAESGGVGRAVIRGLFASLRRARIIKRTRNGWVLLRQFPEPPVSEEGSKRQRAKDFLLAELGSGRLRSGDQLSELALARKSGVATVSMREALLEMMPLGLLTKRERQRWEVAVFSDERIREMREFREMVETFCLKKLLSEKLPVGQRSAFEHNRDTTRLLVQQKHPTIKNILRVDLAFHRLLLEATGNSLLKERAAFIYLIIEFQLVSPFYTIEKGKLGLGQHLRIIDGILREDPASAERSLLEHLRSAERVFCAIVQQFRK